MPSRHSAQQSACSDSKPTKSAAMHADGKHPNTSSCCAKDTCQFNEGIPLAPNLTLDSSAVEQGYADVSSQGIRREETAGGAVSNLNSDLDDALHDAQQLVQAAERIVKESCGEDWLLQPFIPDMERNEYRVYLVGGAVATGGHNDTAVVYTPAFHEYNDKGQRRVYVWNVTLPLHFFSRAPVNPDEVLKPWLSSFKELVAKIDFNSSHVDEYQLSYFPYPIWRDESMHDLIVRVALSAADAVAQSGRSMRMGQHVMLRVDIALTRQGNMAKPFINEAHVFNDAGLSFDVWPPRNGSSASDAPPKPIAINPADDSSHPCNPMASSDDYTLRPEDDICLADHAIAAGEGRRFGVGEDDAIEGVASLTNGSSVGVAAAGEVVGSDMGISRGYLLAVKLWEEAIATVNAKHRSSAH